MAEISTELQTIVNGRYGADIRMAIHDAIQKINVSSGSGGGGVSHGPVGNVWLTPEGWDDIAGSGFANYRNTGSIDYAENASGSARTSATVQMSVLGEHTVLGLVMYTGQNVTITGLASTWQSVCDELMYVATSGGVHHKVNVAIVKRTASYEDVTLSVSTSDSEYIGLKLVVLNQNESISGTPTVTEMDTRSFTVNGDALHDVIYITAAYDDYNPTYTATTTQEITSMTNHQFGAFYKPASGASISFDYSSSASTFPEEGAGLMTVTLS